MSKTVFDMLSTNSVGIEKICPVCKKKFFVHDPRHHAYKKRMKNGYTVPICSWSCLREDEKKREGKYERNRKKKIQNQLMGIQEG